MDLHTDIGAIWSASDLDTASKAVLTVVRYHADEDGNCRVTAERMAEMTGLGRASVFRRMADLVARKIIERIAGFRDGNVYRLNPETLASLFKPSHPETGAGGLRSHSETPPVSHRDPTRLTQRPHPSQSETIGLIDVLCGSDVATRTTELQNKEQATTAATAGAHVHTHAHEAPVATNEAGELIELWVRTQNGSGSRAPGMFASHAAQSAIVELVATHKAERVRWAIGRAVEIATRGAPSLGMLRKLCEEGPLPERAPRNDQHAPRQNSAGRPWVQAVHEPMKRSALFDELLGGKTDGTDV